MREGMIQSVLNDLNGSDADIEVSAVISTDGLLIASMLPAGLDEDRVGAINAAMLTLGDRGDLEQIMIKGRNGYIVMTYAGHDAVLSVLARAHAKLGLIFLDAKRAP